MQPVQGQIQPFNVVTNLTGPRPLLFLRQLILEEQFDRVPDTHLAGVLVVQNVVDRSRYRSSAELVPDLFQYDDRGSRLILAMAQLSPE